jgi:hypothetical protein
MILFISDPYDDHKIGRFLDKIGVDNSTQQWYLFGSQADVSTNPSWKENQWKLLQSSQ